jgi:hypothetical protein
LIDEEKDTGKVPTVDRCAESLPSFSCNIQMARELGLNPKKFGSLANTNQEPLKLPLPAFITELHFKHLKVRKHRDRGDEDCAQEHRAPQK